MVNLLTERNQITGKTLYVVYRSGYNLPASIVFKVYTNCRYTRYLVKTREDGSTEFRCDLHGINERGEDIYITGWYGVIHEGDTNHINGTLFLTMEEAIQRKAEIMNEIEQDIKNLIDNTNKTVEESRKRLKEMAMATTHAHKC